MPLVHFEQHGGHVTLCVDDGSKRAHTQKDDTDPAGEEADPTRMMCADEGLVGLVCLLPCSQLRAVPLSSQRYERRGAAK